MTNQPRTAAGRALVQRMIDADAPSDFRREVLAIEAEAAVPLDDLIEKARDWRYSDGWIGATFRDRLASADKEGGT